jgi:hypothetical protein
MKFAYASKHLFTYDFGYVLGVSVAAERLKWTDGQHNLRRDAPLPDTFNHGRPNQRPEIYDEHTEKEQEYRPPRLPRKAHPFRSGFWWQRVLHFESNVSG